MGQRQHFVENLARFTRSPKAANSVCQSVTVSQHIGLRDALTMQFTFGDFVLKCTFRFSRIYLTNFRTGETVCSSTIFLTTLACLEMRANYTRLITQSSYFYFTTWSNSIRLQHDYNTTTTRLKDKRLSKITARANHVTPVTTYE